MKCWAISWRWEPKGKGTLDLGTIRRTRKNAIRAALANCPPDATWQDLVVQGCTAVKVEVHEMEQARTTGGQD